METMTSKFDITTLKAQINQYIERESLSDFPSNLTDATAYIMSLSGKRLRPIMLLLTANGFGVDTKSALAASVSTEVFHNFTLIHDDIMDEALLRRGKKTVHEKYGSNKAIVAGDAMLPYAIELLIKGHEHLTYPLVNCFLKMAKEVMEGQQYDMQFETQNQVTIEEYLTMIRLKTSVLFGCACQLGAILGNASVKDQENLYDFGLNTGIAFQIMDDYLDTFGDDSFGKRIGGDILLNKKTFLLTNAIKLASPQQKLKIQELLVEKEEDKKIKAFQKLFIEIGVDELAIDTMKEYTSLAINQLNASNISVQGKEHLISLSKSMLSRTI